MKKTMTMVVTALGVVACHGESVGDAPSDASGGGDTTDATTLNDASDGGTSGDADAIADSPLDALPPADAGDSGLLVGSYAGAPNQTGNAQQQHLVWANEGARWWFFHVDPSDPTALRAAWSSDFGPPWNEVSTILPFAGDKVDDARDFGVAYADVGGHDVLRIAFTVQVPDASTGKAFGFQARGALDGDTIAWGPSTQFSTTSYNPGFCDPDGTTAAFSGDGHYYVATGCFNDFALVGGDTTGNMDMWASNGVEDGTTAPTATVDALHSYVHYLDHDRALLPVRVSDLLAVWPRSDVAEDKSETNDFVWALSNDAWMAHDGVFGADADTMQNDWSVCETSPTQVHAVRRKIDGGRNDLFQHARFDVTTKTWTAGDGIPDDPGIGGSGVVLLSNGSHLLLFALASDTTESVRMIEWKSVGGWDASWRTLFGTSANRAFLSGSGCASTTRAAIAWTEGSAPPYAVKGADVTGLF